MKHKITGLFSLGVILLTSLCLCLGGCHKKLIRVEKDGIVEGVVKDSLSLIPVVGADVFLDDNPYLPYPKTDSTGYYQVIRLTGAPVSVKITIKAQGYKTQDKNVVLRPNQTQSLDFFLVKE